MTKFLRFVALGCMLSFTATTASYAQDDINELIRGSASDAEKLVGGYLSPVMKSFSLGLNSGWYNTAKPHKLIGIDLTITASAMRVPNSELFYNIADLKLDEVELAPGSPNAPNAPTIIGPDVSPVYRRKGDTSGDTFEGPSGLDLKGEIGKNWVPVPMVHLGIGLPKGTDLKIRFVPSIDVEDGKLNLFGIGVMHDIKQYIPGFKVIPFDLSAFVGYTHFAMKYAYTPDQSDIMTADPHAEMIMNATTIQGVISKKMSVLTVYGGLGYNIVKSSVGVKGQWDMDGSGTFEESENNPVDIKWGTSGPRATAGFRLKLAVFTLHADYTLQKYNALTVGFGINVR